MTWQLRICIACGRCVSHETQNQKTDSPLLDHYRCIKPHWLRLRAWLVNRLSQHGSEIQAGQFVMTGTATGLPALDSSHAAKVDFGLLGASRWFSLS